MSLGIQIGTEYLRLQPGTVMELEMENPFLQLSDEQLGDFSLPLDIKLDPANLRLLEYSGLLQSRVNNTGIDARVYDNGLQYSTGKLKVEKVASNLNYVPGGTQSLYYLGGWSNFYQDIKGKSLVQVDLGGVRSFPFIDWSRSGNAGWWAHIHSVIDAPAGYGTSGYDYAFYPVINKKWKDDESGIYTDVMNYMKYEAGQVNFSRYTTSESTATYSYNVIVPFPYLKYVLLKAVEHIGWRIEGEVLDDADFKKITLVNFLSIGWDVAALRNTSTYTATVRFDLKDHVPDMEIAEFLLALKNRFGWWYDFDRKSKVIRIRNVNAVAATGVKDFTQLASPLLPKTVNKEPKIYALRNSFVGEYAGGQPSFKAVQLVGSVNAFSDLPTPGESRYGQAYMVITENNYYICRVSEAGTWSWERYAYNVFDYEPEGANEEITTQATTLGCEKWNAYLDFVPRMDNAGIWVGRSWTNSEWGIHMLMYHGKRANKAGQPYPFAGSGVYDSTGAQVAQWALAFECPTTGGGDLGLYARAWKTFFALFSNAEELEVTLYLPKEEWLNLKFSDAIIVAGVKMYIKKISAQLPYKESVRLECIRI